MTASFKEMMNIPKFNFEEYHYYTHRHALEVLWYIFIFEKKNINLNL